MKRNKCIVRFTVEELEAMRRCGEDRSDDARLERMTPAKIEAESREDEAFDWRKAQTGIPSPESG